MSRRGGRPASEELDRLERQQRGSAPGRRRRSMTLRGKLTVLFLMAIPVSALVALYPSDAPGSGGRPGAGLPPVSLAPLPEVVPEDLLARLPVSRAAFEAAAAGREGAERLSETIATAAGPLTVEYTLRAGLGRQVFRLLERSRVSLGHVLVMDTERSELLAYASTDVERFPPTAVYPAASLIKVVTAAAALDESPATAQQPCFFTGSPYRLTAKRIDPPRGGNEVSLRKALATSNNQCFAQLAVHKIGAPAMLSVIRRFGLLDAPGVAHAAGVAQDPGEDRFALGRLGCGLSGCQITPLHAARLAGTLTDGVLRDPQWIERVMDATGDELVLPAPAPERRVMTPELAGTLREMLVDTTRRGTARKAYRTRRGHPLLQEVRVAGKTGSLSGKNPTGRYEWFMGVAPAEDPKVAVAVLLVQNDLWWRNASQVSAEVFKLLFCPKGVCSTEALGRWVDQAEAPLPGLPVVDVSDSR